MSAVDLRGWKFYVSYLSTRRNIYVIGILSLLLAGIMQTLQPRLIGAIIDFFQDPNWHFLNWGLSRIDIFYLLIGAFLFLHLFLFLGRWGWRRFLARETHYAGVFMRRKVWKQAQLLRQEELNTKFTPGVIMSLSSSDVSAAKFIFGFVLVGTFDVFFLLLLSFVGMLQINHTIAFASLLSLPLVGYFSWKLAKLEIRAYRDSKKVLADFNDLVAQIIAMIKLQRLSGNLNFWQDLLYRIASEYRSSKLKAILIGLYYFPILALAIVFSYGVLFFYGVEAIKRGELTLGEFIGLQGYILLLQNPILSIGFIIAEWQRSRASLQRLIEFYEHPVDSYLLKRQDVEFDKQKPLFVLENLNFSYSTGEKVIEDFSLEILSGEKIGFKGDIGSGKSTLFKILSGIESYYEGSARFYGIELKDINKEQLTKHIVYVSQENFLFASSIRENVCLDLSCSDELIWYYLEIAGVAEDVREFEHGLDTELGEWGINLSGGQKQRLCLARALIRRPDILLLDDCLSAVDLNTELIVLDNLERELANMTVLWIAHRDTTLQKCTRIVQLERKIGNRISE